MDRHRARRGPAVKRAACLTIALGIVACRHPDSAEPVSAVDVRCVSAERVALDENVLLRGRLQPPPGGDLAVASQVAGRIMSVNVREGQRVAAGDLVASVDDLASRDAVRQADAALSQARANQTNADAVFARTQELVVRGIAAKQELEDARAKAESAHAGVSASAASADLAHRTLGRVQVRSTLDGVVTRILRGPGALVDGTSGTPVVQLASTGGSEFVADATERELRTIAIGQASEVLVVGADASLRGAVRARAAALDPATGLGTIRVALDPLPPGIPIGAYGRATITTRHRNDVPMLPIAALRGAVLDGVEIVVCSDGKGAVRSVKIGYRDDERFEVVEGLAAQERVAIDHVLGLETGSAIREVK
jgi:RND family efflux transporter MFP subunit